eukprot:GEMP01006534.1.p1 GENE.GEMP01006534.1~~GEMP01006534.1.p1  ORF type:complete len:1169 (+),score=252.12 GEMP01006534.1:164-3670(+)
MPFFNMVLRRKLLLSTLKDYVLDLNEDQISASLLKGEVTLTNLDLEPSKIADLLIDIWPQSLELKVATVAELQIKIPWSKLISHSSKVKITTLTLECELHLATEEEWNDQVYRNLEVANERVKARYDAGPYNFNTLDTLRKRVIDGLQVQIDDIKIKIFTPHSRHIPKCIDADRFCVEAELKDIVVAPANGEGETTTDLKESNVLQQSPHKVVTTYKKISIGSLGVNGRTCGSDDSAPLFAPIPLNCLVHLESPADSSRICPFLSTSNVMWSFPERIAIETCDCQLQALLATVMDLLRMEAYRLDARFHRPTAPEQVLPDCTSVTRTFARGPAKEEPKNRKSRTFWSDLWAKKPRKGSSAQPSSVARRIGSKEDEREDDNVSYATVDSSGVAFVESISSAAAAILDAKLPPGGRRLSQQNNGSDSPFRRGIHDIRLATSGERDRTVEGQRAVDSGVDEAAPEDTKPKPQQLAEYLRPIMPTIQLAAGNLGSLFAKKPASKVVTGFHFIDIDALEGSESLDIDLGFISPPKFLDAIPAPASPTKSSASVVGRSPFAHDALLLGPAISKIEPGFHKIDLDTIEGLLSTAANAVPTLDKLKVEDRRGSSKIEPGFHPLLLDMDTGAATTAATVTTLTGGGSGVKATSHQLPSCSVGEPDAGVSLSKDDCPADVCDPVQADSVSVEAEVDDIFEMKRGFASCLTLDEGNGEHDVEPQVAEVTKVAAKPTEEDEMEVLDGDFFSVVSSHDNLNDQNNPKSLWTRVQHFFGASDATSMSDFPLDELESQGEGPWEVQLCTKVHADVTLQVSLKESGEIMKLNIEGLDFTQTCNRRYHADEYACFQRLRSTELPPQEEDHAYPYISSAGTMLWRSLDLSMSDQKVAVAKGPQASRWEWKDRTCPPVIMSGLPIWPFHLTFREMWVMLEPVTLEKLAHMYVAMVPFLKSAVPPPPLLPAVFEGSDVDELWPVDSVVIDLIDCTIEEPTETGMAESRWPFAIKSPKLRISSISELLNLDSRAASIQRVLPAMPQMPVGGAEDDVILPKAMFSALVANMDSAMRIQAQLEGSRKELQRAYKLLEKDPKKTTPDARIKAFAVSAGELNVEEMSLHERVATLEASLKAQDLAVRRTEDEYMSYRTNMKQHVESIIRNSAQRDSELQYRIRCLEVQPADAW